MKSSTEPSSTATVGVEEHSSELNSSTSTSTSTSLPLELGEEVELQKNENIKLENHTDNVGVDIRNEKEDHTIQMSNGNDNNIENDNYTSVKRRGNSTTSPGKQINIENKQIIQGINCIDRLIENKYRHKQHNKCKSYL